MRATCHHESLSTLEAVLRMDKNPIHHKNQSHKPTILEISKEPKLMNS